MVGGHGGGCITQPTLRHGNCLSIGRSTFSKVQRRCGQKKTERADKATAFALAQCARRQPDRSDRPWRRRPVLAWGAPETPWTSLENQPAGTGAGAPDDVRAVASASEDRRRADHDVGERPTSLDYRCPLSASGRIDEMGDHFLPPREVCSCKSMES